MVVIESALERLELVAVDGGAEGELMYRSIINCVNATAVSLNKIRLVSIIGHWVFGNPKHHNVNPAMDVFWPLADMSLG